jgi:hypothetical protein
MEKRARLATIIAQKSAFDRCVIVFLGLMAHHLMGGINGIQYGLITCQSRKHSAQNAEESGTSLSTLIVRSARSHDRLAARYALLVVRTAWPCTASPGGR